ncbi:MAG: ATP-grasp domain-containing protein [Planctomycetes bacterium]|nr:ATP-grasp domain-containing protein [Planctomycetota bacterium]
MTRVTVLYNDDSRLAHGSPEDAIAVQAVIECAKAVASSLVERGYDVELEGLRGTPRDALRVLEGLRTDVVFNLVEALGGDSRLEQAAAWSYELCGLRYTGSGPRAMALCMEKPLTKALLTARGLPVPRGATFERGDEPVGALRFPLVVKPSREDASHGISSDSLVRDEPALRRQARHVIETYAQAALVEEYIEAREINVALLHGPAGLELLPLSEIDYSGFGAGEARLVTYAGKWIESSRDWALTQVIPARALQPAQRERIEHVARATFEALGLCDYGRVDLRLDTAGEPYVIDVNPNPDISPGAGFQLAAARAGISHADIVQRIVESALGRSRASA